MENKGCRRLVVFGYTRSRFFVPGDQRISLATGLHPKSLQFEGMWLKSETHSCPKICQMPNIPKTKLSSAIFVATGLHCS